MNLSNASSASVASPTHSLDRSKSDVPSKSDIHSAAAVLSYLFEPGRLDVYALVVEHGHDGALDRILSGRAGKDLAGKARMGLRKGEPSALGEELLAQARLCSGRLVIPGDAEWPDQLTGLAALTVDDSAAAPPIGLWVRGNRSITVTTERSVAIVGARAATGYGRYLASDFARELASSGWAVVSGGAYGIDAAAHRGAMGSGGLTVAVLACGVDVAYPHGNRELLESIAETGLVISEWPPGQGPRRYRFLIRNRVIAALSNGTVVVEAARRSGSRVTARRAEELGRPVMAVPGPVNSPLSGGTHELIRDWGARLVTNAADVVAEVGGIGEGFAAALAMEDVRSSATLSVEHKEVFNGLLLRRSLSLQELAARCGFSPQQVRGVLPDLLALGLAVERPDGYRSTSVAPSA